MGRAHDATVACDFFLVAGSSLVIYPAPGFPLTAKRDGANLNRTPTAQDDYAELVIRTGIGARFSAVIAQL
jgi:NAD-dependent deacetylase